MLAAYMLHIHRQKMLNIYFWKYYHIYSSAIHTVKKNFKNK